jgi:hypothetical protein
MTTKKEKVKIMLESATSKQLWKINRLAWEYAELVENLQDKGELELTRQIPFPISKVFAVDIIKSWIEMNLKLAELVQLEQDHTKEVEQSNVND